MADVIILTDFEEGHIFPTFKMAKNLVENGVSVCYVGVRNIMNYVENQGFEYEIILEDMFPQEGKGSSNSMAEAQVLSQQFYQGLMDGVLDTLFDKLKPKVLLTSYFIKLEALILAYKYDIPQIVYHLMLPPYVEAKPLSFPALVKEICVKSFAELSGETPNKIIEFILKHRPSIKNLSDITAPFDEMGHFVLCPQALRIRGDKTEYEKVQYLGPCI